MNGAQIALIAISVVLLILEIIAGRYIQRLLGAIKALTDAIVLALEDNKVTDEELAEIIKRGKTVKDVLFEIAQLIAKKNAN